MPDHVMRIHLLSDYVCQSDIMTWHWVVLHEVIFWHMMWRQPSRCISNFAKKNIVLRPVAYRRFSGPHKKIVRTHVPAEYGDRKPVSGFLQFFSKQAHSAARSPAVAGPAKPSIRYWLSDRELEIYTYVNPRSQHGAFTPTRKIPSIIFSFSQLFFKSHCIREGVHRIIKNTF